MEQILNRKDFTEWLIDSDIPYDAEAEQIRFSEMGPRVTLEVLVTANDADVDMVSDSLTAHYASPNTSVTDAESFKNAYQRFIQEKETVDGDRMPPETHGDENLEMVDIRKLSVDEVVEICMTVHSVDSLNFGGYGVTSGSGFWNIISTE